MNNSLQKRRRVAFWSAFWASMTAPALAVDDKPSITRISLPEVTPRDSMRGDWERIGEDFGRVIAREEIAHKKNH